LEGFHSQYLFGDWFNNSFTHFPELVYAFFPSEGDFFKSLYESLTIQFGSLRSALKT
jgi:hypothetical protein